MGGAVAVVVFSQVRGQNSAGDHRASDVADVQFLDVLVLQGGGKRHARSVHEHRISHGGSSDISHGFQREFLLGRQTPTIMTPFALMLSFGDSK